MPELAHPHLVRRFVGFMTFLFTVASGGALAYGLYLSEAHWATWLILAPHLALTTTVVLMLFVGLVGIRLLRHRHSAPLKRPAKDLELPKIGVLIPLYDEDSARVFAGVEAVRTSLERSGRGDSFDIFLLSDSRDPESWARETYLSVECRKTDRPGRPKVFYRHRTKNEERKTGNLRDFFSKWGHLYEYVVVFDADSLMSGSTLVELARRMQADPELGILQVPCRPVRGRTLFARILQFAGDVYGAPLFEGLRVLYDTEANFWGHNAIIRTEAFTEHCGLPVLPGPPPLGGPVLSHDFVEAALMRRAGYRVIVASDLEASYEELPPNIATYLARDRRWAQGNMQHLRLLSSDLPSANRLWLLHGAMGYLIAPLLIIFLVVSTLSGLATNPEAAPFFITAISITAVAVIGPKLIGTTAALLQLGDAEKRGGLLALLTSTVLETLITAIWAPIMILRHGLFVAQIFLGRDSGWKPQVRDGDRVTWGEAFSNHALETLLGLAVTGLLAWRLPIALLGLTPILFGLVFAAPIAKIVGSAKLGKWAHDFRLFVSGPEATPPHVVRLTDETLPVLEEKLERFDSQDIVVDPSLLRLHLQLLEKSKQASPARPKLIERAMQMGWPYLSQTERFEILADPTALRQLHAREWTVGNGIEERMSRIVARAA